MPLAETEIRDRCGETSSSPKGLAGHLRFEAISDGNRTRIGRQSFQCPFHFGKGYWDGSALQIRIVNATAGILAGDALDVEGSVGTGASVAVILPAATRVFMMRGGARAASATCRQAYRVAEGAWLEHAPEPLFPHAGANYSQTTHLDLAQGAACYFVDALAPGRVGRGELWAWERLRLRLEVTLGGQPVLIEQLDATGPALARQAAFYGMPEAWFATLLIASPALSDDAPLWLKLRSLHAEGTVIGSTCPAAGVWVVRIVASTGLALRDTLASARLIASESLPQLQTDLRRL